MYRILYLSALEMFREQTLYKSTLPLPYETVHAYLHLALVEVLH